MAAPGSHYFDEEPTTESAPRDVSLLLPDMHLTLRTDRGVFGYNRIDAGTKLLLLKAPAPSTSGELLDLGLGDRRAGHGRQQHAPQRVAERVAEAALERFDDHAGVTGGRRRHLDDARTEEFANG